MNLVQPLDVFRRVISSLDYMLCRREERERLVQYFDPVKDELLAKIQMTEGLQADQNSDLYR